MGRKKITDASKRKRYDKEQKLTHGVGINDADYVTAWYEYIIVDGVEKKIWRECPHFSKWRLMLGRCYPSKITPDNRCYEDAEVCEDWKYFSKFLEWSLQNYKDGYSLDKDLFLGNNKKYSPLYCTYLPSEINNFLLLSDRTRGEWPIGVVKRPETGKFRASCRDNLEGKTIRLGQYDDPSSAHNAWLNAKSKICQRYILKYNDDSRIKEGLQRVKDKIDKCISEGTELKDFN